MRRGREHGGLGGGGKGRGRFVTAQTKGMTKYVGGWGLGKATVVYWRMDTPARPANYLYFAPQDLLGTVPSLKLIPTELFQRSTAEHWLWPYLIVVSREVFGVVDVLHELEPVDLAPLLVVLYRRQFGRAFAWDVLYPQHIEGSMFHGISAKWHVGAREKSG